MLHPKLILTTTLVLALIVGARNGLTQEVYGDAPQPGNAIAPVATPYSSSESYFHNYPHEVPPDYVYRTGRLFAPELKQDRDNFFFSFLKRGQQGQTTSAARYEPGAELNEKVRQLTSQLLENAAEPVADGDVITVSTFVNLNHLYQTSALGRYIGEQMLSELQKAGVHVLDVRKTAGIMVMENYGEYGLSRNMEELSYIHTSQAMIVGTYTFVNRQILLNARLLRNTDGMVLSSGSLVLDLNPMLEGLLADESMPVAPGQPVQLRAFNDKQE